MYLGPGIYNEKVVIEVSGSSAAGPITFTGSGAGAILDGTGVAGEDLILLQDASYVRIVGLEIRNSLGVNDGSGIRVLGGGDHIEIRNNWIHDVHGVSAMGITVYGTDPEHPVSNLVIDGNHIEHCDPSDSEALTLNGNVEAFAVTNNVVNDVNNIGIDFIGGEGVSPDPATDAARNGVCSGNTVFRARSNYGGGYAAGIYVDGGSGIVVAGNAVHDCDEGIEIGAENAGVVASGMTVRDNVIYNNDKYGLVFGGYDATRGRVENSQFLNNTCYKNDTLSLGYGEIAINYASSSVVRNNIFYCTSQDLLLTAGAGSVGNSMDYNLWFAEAGPTAAQFVWNDAAETGYAAYLSASGQDAHSIFGDPRLANPGAADFHLASGSPAIDAGDPSFAPAAGETDFYGDARLVGPRVDIGAAEHGSSNAACPADPNSLCVDSGRFLVQVQWTDFQGHTGFGSVVPGATSNNSGVMWFFSPDDWELLVKVLDGCGVNGHYWVLGAAATNVSYTIQATDLQAGTVRTYTNPLGTSAPAITDTGAFATCP